MKRAPGQRRQLHCRGECPSRGCRDQGQAYKVDPFFQQILGVGDRCPGREGTGRIEQESGAGDSGTGAGLDPVSQVWLESQSPPGLFSSEGGADSRHPHSPGGGWLRNATGVK